MPKLQMSPPWLAGITSDRDAEYIDAVQPGLVLRIRRGRMVWFVRYLFDGSARRYRIGPHPAVGLSLGRAQARVGSSRPSGGGRRPAKREAGQAGGGTPAEAGRDSRRRPGHVAEGREARPAGPM